MKVNIIRHDVLCDVSGCKNLAKYSISLGSDENNSTYFCKDCLQNLSRVVSQNIVPKGIENVIKNRTKKEVINGK